jgi:hypothetical protein
VYLAQALIYLETHNLVNLENLNRIVVQTSPRMDACDMSPTSLSTLESRPDTPKNFCVKSLDEPRAKSKMRPIYDDVFVLSIEFLEVA